jgi:hypothetical protein
MLYNHFDFRPEISHSLDADKVVNLLIADPNAKVISKVRKAEA